MKHSFDSYATPVRRSDHGPNWYYYYPDEWRQASSWFGSAVFIFIVAVVTTAIAAGEGAIPWMYPIIISTLFAAAIAGHVTLCWTYDGRSLGPIKAWALKKFNKLPDDLKAELGGRDNFVARLEGITTSDTQKLIDHLDEAMEAVKNREKEESRLASDVSDMTDALTRYRQEQDTFVRTLKELT